MTFLTFLSYFIVAKLIYEAFMVGIYYIYKKYINYRFKKAIKDGKIKIVKLDDLVDNVEDDSTWH